MIHEERWSARARGLIAPLFALLVLGAMVFPGAGSRLSADWARAAGSLVSSGQRLEVELARLDRDGDPGRAVAATARRGSSLQSSTPSTKRWIGKSAVGPDATPAMPAVDAGATSADPMGAVSTRTSCTLESRSLDIRAPRGPPAAPTA